MPDDAPVTKTILLSSPSNKEPESRVKRPALSRIYAKVKGPRRTHRLKTQDSARETFLARFSNVLAQNTQCFRQVVLLDQ